MRNAMFASRFYNDLYLNSERMQKIALWAVFVFGASILPTFRVPVLILRGIIR